MKSIARATTHDANGKPFDMRLNGAFTVDFPLGVTLTFAGAPFRLAHLAGLGSSLFRVKAATEVPGDAEVFIPCVDFGVPNEADMLAAVAAAVEAAFAGKTVFAGCMGGIG